jgi:hypothetical protein
MERAITNAPGNRSPRSAGSDGFTNASSTKPSSTSCWRQFFWPPNNLKPFFKHHVYSPSIAEDYTISECVCSCMQEGYKSISHGQDSKTGLCQQLHPK